MKDKKLWAKRLSALEGYSEDVEKSKTVTGSSDLPDARYEGKITEAKLGDSQAGDLQIIVECAIINDDEYDGVKTTAFLGLEGKARIYTLSTLRRLGYEIEGEDAKEEIIPIVDDLNKSNLGVILKRKGGYTNIQGPSEDVGEDAEEEEGEETMLEVTEGVKVSWESGGETRTGTVIEVLEEENIARVEKEDGKVSRVKIELLTIEGGADEEEEEEEEEEDVPEDAEDSEESEDEDEDEEEDEEDEDEDEDEEDEEEEDEAPKRKRAKAKKTKTKKATKKKVARKKRK